MFCGGNTTEKYRGPSDISFFVLFCIAQKICVWFDNNYYTIQKAFFLSFYLMDNLPHLLLLLMKS